MSLYRKRFSTFTKAKPIAKPIKSRGFSPSILVGVGIMAVSISVYFNSFFEEVEHQTVQIPAQGFYAYDIALSEPNVISLKLECINEKYFDFCILESRELERLKQSLLDGVPPVPEILYLHKQDHIQWVDETEIALVPGEYSLVMANPQALDNSYDTNEKPTIDFRIFQKQSRLNL